MGRNMCPPMVSVDVPRLGHHNSNQQEAHCEGIGWPCRSGPTTIGECMAFDNREMGPTMETNNCLSMVNDEVTEVEHPSNQHDAECQPSRNAFGHPGVDSQQQVGAWHLAVARWDQP
jgi:hypothetical protein